MERIVSELVQITTENEKCINDRRKSVTQKWLKQFKKWWRELVRLRNKNGGRVSCNVGLPDFKCNTASNDSISTDGREAERGDIWREVTELWMDFI